VIEPADETRAEPAWTRRIAGARKVLVVACGALAREIVSLRDGPLGAFDVTCLPAELHNRPSLIPEAMRARIRENSGRYDEVLCLYGDCGTGGKLDEVLREEGATRIDGAHCYEFFAGATDFAAMMEAEPGTFFVTDFLVRHFDRLVVKGLGLDRHPELRDDYFRHYRRLVHLAQIDDAALDSQARRAADRLGLAHERRFTGVGALESFVAKEVAWPA